MAHTGASACVVTAQVLELDLRAQASTASRFEPFDECCGRLGEIRASHRLKGVCHSKTTSANEGRQFAKFGQTKEWMQGRVRGVVGRSQGGRTKVVKRRPPPADCRAEYQTRRLINNLKSLLGSLSAVYVQLLYAFLNSTKRGNTIERRAQTFAPEICRVLPTTCRYCQRPADTFQRCFVSGNLDSPADLGQESDAAVAIQSQDVQTRLC